MRKTYKYGLIIIALAFLGYHSVYFEKLSNIIASEEVKFDFEVFTDSLYYEGILKNDLAIEFSKLLTEIQNAPEGAFEKYGNRLGIGNSAYFMVKCKGKITEITSEGIKLTTENAKNISINTRYIFGNALRDASGLVKLTDFKTNTEFNQVSESLNSLIRTKIIPPIVSQLETGNNIEVIGAIKLSKKNLNDPFISITPAKITIE